MDKFAEFRAFTTVIDAGGFSAAGRKMGQSRSSVNRLVLALEERLGVQLLNRTTRSVSPTSAGRALYDRVVGVLQELDEIEDAVGQSRTEAVGKLRLSAPLPFGDLDFSQIIVGFLKRHPKVQIDASFEARIVDPIAEGFDLVIRSAPPDEETTLVDHRILTLEYVLCAAPGYLDARGAPVAATDLSDHACLYLKQGAERPVWTLGAPGGEVSVPIHPVLVANTLELLRAAACAGLGIAALPAYAVRSDLAAGRLSPVLPDHQLPQRMLQVIYPPARHLSAKVRLFTDFVQEWCGT